MLAIVRKMLRIFVDAIEMNEPAELLVNNVNYVIGLDGRHLTISDLPTSDMKR
jgi:hypothetical protein